MQELLEAKRLRLPTEEESEKYRKIIKEYFEEKYVSQHLDEPPEFDIK